MALANKLGAHLKALPGELLSFFGVYWIKKLGVLLTGAGTNGFCLLLRFGNIWVL